MDGTRRPATLTLGGRLDRFERTGETRALPQASLGWAVSGRIKLMAAFGEYAQFPVFEQQLGRHGNRELRAERATHDLFGVEYSLGTSTRLRLEAYDEDPTGLLFNNKAFIFERWRLTLYGEVVNLLNRTHTRYTGLDELDARTGRVFLESDTLFPFLPSAGVTVEF